MLLWILFLACLSITGSLTQSNFSDFISENQSIPALVLVKSLWCPHCAELAPEWDRLETAFIDDPRILIASILLETDRPLCDLLPGTGTPRIFWIPSGVPSHDTYRSSHNFESFVSFINKKLSDRVTLLQTHDEYLAIQTSLFDYSLFILQDFSSNVSEQHLFKISQSFDDHPVRFFRLNYTEFPKVTNCLIYRWPLGNQTIFYEHELSDVNTLTQFIDQYSVPAMSNVTTFFIKNGMIKDRFLLFYQGSDIQFTEEITRLATEFPPDLKGGIVDCSAYPRFCGLFSIWPILGTQLILVRPKKNIYHKFSSTFTIANVSAWIGRALEGKEKEFGPGAGLAGMWFNFKIGMKSRDFRLKVFGIVALIVGLGVAIAVAIVWLNAWVHEEEIMEKKRLIRIAEDRLEEEAAQFVEDLIKEDELIMKKKTD